MFLKKHKHKNKRISNYMMKSTHFHLDHEEDRTAREAKRQLQLCSREDNFQEHYQLGHFSSNPKSRARTEKQSIRTTVSYNCDIKPEMADRRVILSKLSADKKEYLKQQKKTELKDTSSKALSLASIQLSEYKKNVGGKSPLSRKSITQQKKFEGKTIINHKIHQNQSIKKAKPFILSRRYYAARENSELEKKHYYSYNDAIHKQNIPNNHQGQPNSTSPKQAVCRNDGKLRSEFFRLLEKIKEEQNNCNQINKDM